MISGEWYSPTRVIFGPGSVSRVADLVTGRRVLLHYGQKSFKEIGLHGRITGALSEAGVRWVELGGVVHNPRESLVSEGIRLCREHDVEFILAVGGGSVIDSAKAIGIGVPHDKGAMDFFLGNARPKGSLPVGVVVTVPGSGSESNCGALLSDGDLKLGCSAEVMFPEWAVLDPEVVVGAPKRLIAAGIVDAASHALERFYPQRNNGIATWKLGGSLFYALVTLAWMFSDEPSNVDTLGEIMWASKLAHDGTVGFGRKGDWASHQIAHEIAALHPDVPHAELIGVVMRAWLLFFDLPEGRPFSRLLDEFSLPNRLRDLGVRSGCFDKVVNRCASINPSGTIGNYQRLGKDDVRKILEKAR